MVDALPTTPPNSAGWRLWKASGLDVDAYISMAERTNLLKYWPGSSWRSRHATEATAAAMLIRLEEAKDPRTAFLLGRRVEACFGLEGTPWFVPKRDVGWAKTCYVVPHPSGRSTIWNDRETWAKMRDLFARAISGRSDIRRTKDAATEDRTDAS